MAFPELNFRVQEVQPLHIALKYSNIKECRMLKFDILNSGFKACSFFDPATPKLAKNVVQRMAFPELNFRVQEV